MKKNANKGFSLVELIIVIAIMAVLIGVLAPQFIKQVEKSRESTDLQNIEEYKTAIETFVADYGESLTADITITIAGGASSTVTIANATAGTHNLQEYGVPASIPNLKSGKWDAITWTYDCAKASGETAQPNYTWSHSADPSTAGAAYFFWNGNAR